MDKRKLMTSGYLSPQPLQNPQFPQNPFHHWPEPLSGASRQLSLKGEFKTIKPRCARWKYTPFGASHHLSPGGGTGPMDLLWIVGSLRFAVRIKTLNPKP